jgi:hypothetical protein
MVVPLGTMLGAFTLSVLNRQSVRLLFDESALPYRSAASSGEPGFRMG